MFICYIENVLTNDTKLDFISELTQGVTVNEYSIQNIKASFISKDELVDYT